jgi:hypothetical protein
LLPIRIAPIVSIRIWIRGVIVFSPEVKLFALEKRVGIFQFAKAHYFSFQDFSCDGDSPPSLEDVRIHVPLSADNESSFGALKLRFLHPIQRALQNDNEGRSVFLIDGFNNLSTPYHDFALVGLRILKDLSEADRSVCLGS